MNVIDNETGMVFDTWQTNTRIYPYYERLGTSGMLIHRGGTPQSAAPRQLNCGMALFTLMDGGQPASGKGLVRLCGSYELPASFVEGPTLFGQGAEMQVRKFEVRSSVAGSRDSAGD